MNGYPYFITFKTISKILTPEDQILVLKHIIQGNKRFYNLIAAVVMPDHVHILLIPIENYTLSRIMKGIKGVSARKKNLINNSSGSIWQNEYYDRIIRSEKDLLEKLNYMLYNPVKKKLVRIPWKYFGWYLNEDFEIL